MFIPSWQTKEGQLIRVDQMQRSHLLNCIAKIKRSRIGWRKEWLERLELELIIREVKGDG